MTATDSLMNNHPLKLVLAAALLALLSACGDDQQTGQEQEPAAGDSGMSEQTPAQPDAGPGTTESDTGAEQEAGAGNMTSGADEAAAADTAGNQGGGGESHTVNARATAFDPVVVKINPGDRVKWTNMSGHNVHFEKGNIPEGAEPYQSPLGENVSRVFDNEGLYLYKCDPHFAMGMVGAIIVGEPDNVEQVASNAQGMYKRALAKAKAQLQ